MTLAQLQAFIEAARLESFTRAAEELRMSQPAISDLIRRLEHELGSRLFHRGSRQLLLTDAGRTLLPHALQSIASAESGSRAVRELLELESGTATFGLLRNADFYLGVDFAIRFHERYPNVLVRLVGQNSAETAADVARGALEAGLVTLPIDDDGLDVVPLARDEILYVTADPDRAKRKVTIDRLAAAPLVLYDAHYANADPARRQLASRAQLSGVTLQPVVEVEYLSSALRLVEAGVGDSIICRAAAESDLMPAGLHTVPFAEPLFDTLAFVKRRGLVLSPATRVMAGMAWEALKTDQATRSLSLLPETSQLRHFLGRPDDGPI